jgi:hypothetical protein
VNERQHPRARLGTLGEVPAGGAPDCEKRLLHRVLGKRIVSEDSFGQGVGNAAKAAIELGERLIVALGDQAEQVFISQRAETLRTASAVGA